MPPGPEVARQTPRLSNVLRLAASHERSGFLVAHLDESNLVLMRSKSFHDSINTVAWESDNDFNSPQSIRPSISTAAAVIQSSNRQGNACPSSVS
jgi:hypothetical protein